MELMPAKHRYDPLTVDENHESVHDALPIHGPSRGQNTPKRLLFFVIAGCLFVMIVISGVYWKAKYERRGRIYSPAAGSIEYQSITFEGGLDAPSIYKGKGLSADKAWLNLMRHESIVVSQDTLNNINRSSVSYSHGLGYLATLDVYHQLHCVNYLRKHILYGAQDNMKMDDIHIDHCLDMLRQVIMCNADITLITYDWKPDISTEKPWPNFNVQHDCRNFDAVDDWAEAHQPPPDAYLINIK